MEKEKVSIYIHIILVSILNCHLILTEKKSCTNTMSLHIMELLYVSFISLPLDSISSPDSLHEVSSLFLTGLPGDV